LAPASAAVRPPAPAVDLRERECGQQREQRDRERPGERVVEGRRGLRGGRARLGQRARQRDLSTVAPIAPPIRCGTLSCGCSVRHACRTKPATSPAPRITAPSPMGSSIVPNCPQRASP
jgi:hypothetical protein